jgi:hypothetical protein
MMMPVTTYSELIGVIRDQVGALGVRYQDFDALVDFAPGLTGKAFGPSQVKRLGSEKLFDALRGAGLRLRVEQDPEQLEKMRKRIAENFLPRQRNQARMNNHSSPVGTILTSRVFKHYARLGGKKSWQKKTAKERFEHQRKASLARWAKYRKRIKAANRRKQRQRNEGASL